MSRKWRLVTKEARVHANMHARTHTKIHATITNKQNQQITTTTHTYSISTHISTPDRYSERVVSLIQVHLDHGKSKLYLDREAGVDDGPASEAHLPVVLDQVLGQSFLIRRWGRAITDVYHLHHPVIVVAIIIIINITIIIGRRRCVLCIERDVVVLVKVGRIFLKVDLILLSVDTFLLVFVVPEERRKNTSYANCMQMIARLYIDLRCILPIFIDGSDG